jgi:hypothetical protein
MVCRSREADYADSESLKEQAAGLGLDVARIRTGFTHIDLPPSQESSFGHSRLTALAPATSET